jgi:predicted lipid-binding transport protein (Tim44 family)
MLHAKAGASVMASAHTDATESDRKRHLPSAEEVKAGLKGAAIGTLVGGGLGGLFGSATFGLIGGAIGTAVGIAVGAPLLGLISAVTLNAPGD